MKTDAYAKTILTVIAASLLWLCLENPNRPKVVSAQGPVKVIIASVDSGAIVPLRIWGLCILYGLWLFQTTEDSDEINN
jgi:hypothetical protein